MMLNNEQLNKQYMDYKVYSVLKLKNKYGFKVKLIFSDTSEEIRQIGGFKTKCEANKERNKVIYELINRTFVVYPKIKVNDYLNYWLENIMKPEITYNSYMSYRNIVKNYLNDFFDNLLVSQINIGHIQKLYNTVSQKNKSAAKMTKAVIRSAMKYAKSKNLIESNPTLNVNLPKCVESNENKVIKIDVEQTLSIKQVKILINASKETPIHLQIMFAVLMGLRKQEINGLKYTDIDFINRKLYLKRQLGVDNKKAKDDCCKKTYTKQEIKLKTKSSERVLDIPDLLFEAILEERKKYEKNKKRRINDKTNLFLDDKYICCSTYGHSRSKGFHNKYYHKLLQDNDLPKIKFHDLRHTFTTLLLMNNYDLKAISELLGHSDTIITSNIYFDKDKVVIDCVNDLSDYIDRVKPKEEKQDILVDLDTNFMQNKICL